MVDQRTTAPRGFDASGLKTFLSDTAALYVRSLRKLRRRPVALYFSLVQPLVWLFLFGQMFSRLAVLPGASGAFGGRSYLQFFIPSVILQTLLFGSAQSGIGILQDMDSGFLNKLLTTPVRRMAILLGKVLADLTRMLIQGGLILTLGWTIGQFQSPKLSFAYGLPGLAGGLAIAVLFGLGLAGFNVFIALRTGNTESTFLIANFLTLPMLFTSSALLPISLLPDWLQAVASVNPVTYAIGAIRLLWNGVEAAGGADPQRLLATAFLVLGAIAALTLTLAVRSFQQRVR